MPFAPPCERDKGATDYAIYTSLVTSAAVMHGGIGPQLTINFGPFQTYATGALRYRYLRASSMLMRTDRDAVAGSTNEYDAGFTWSAGGGVLFGLPMGASRASIEMGVQRYYNRSTRFLRPGDIRFSAYWIDSNGPIPLPRPQYDIAQRWFRVAGRNGAIVMPPVRTDADLVVYHVGIRIPVH